MGKSIKLTLAILGLGAICAAGIIEAGEAERRRIEAEAVTHTPPIETVEVWAAPETPADAVTISEDDAPPFLGDFKITVYHPGSDNGAWGYQTATGVTSQHLTTCAVDPGVIPLGTVLDIGGELTVTAVDTGSAVQGNVIDVFYDGSSEEALDWIAEFGDSAPVWVQETTLIR